MNMNWLIPVARAEEAADPAFEWIASPLGKLAEASVGKLTAHVNIGDGVFNGSGQGSLKGCCFCC